MRTLILMPTIQLHLQLKPRAIGLIRYKHSTHEIRLLVREKTVGNFLSQWSNTIKSLTHLPPSFPWLTAETLYSPSVFILFSNARKIQKNSSTIKARCSDVPIALQGFSQGNKCVRNFSLNWQFWFYEPKKVFQVEEEKSEQKT